MNVGGWVRSIELMLDVTSGMVIDRAGLGS